MTENENKLERMRHSTAHVMAQAVATLFPEAKLGIGPTIEDGFYYDFDLPRSLTMDDLPKIEEVMRELIAADMSFIREEVDKERARQIFASQPYKYPVEVLFFPLMLHIRLCQEALQHLFLVE